MKELSLHILDIMQNSVRADASLIKLQIWENIKENKLEIKIEDNGKGMDEKLVRGLTDPFTTTRTTRKVGLGIPMLQEAAERCNGYLSIKSKLGVGTKVKVVFDYDDIDRAPLGDVVNTISMLILSKPQIRYIATYIVNESSFVMDTKEIKDLLDGVPINDLSIIKWLENYMEENISALKG